MSRLEIRLFGNLALAYEGAPWPFVSPRLVRLLGYLVAHPGQSIARQALATLLWPDEADDFARAKLRRLLYLVVQALPPGGWLEVRASTVRWNRSPNVWVDTETFEQAASEERFTDATSLYRGDFLPGVDDEWALVERQRLQAIYVTACHQAALDARRDRDFEAVLSYTDKMLSVDEWREDAVRLEMTVRYESGDRTGALAAFDRFCTNLRREMNVEPMPETVALRAAILGNEALPGQFEPAGASPDRARSAMPFVGRVPELEFLEEAWLRAARGHGTTVFVAGEAGIGKSRLVSEAVSRIAAQGGRAISGATSHPEAFPYETLVDAFRSSIGLILELDMDKRRLAPLSALMPELRAAIPDLPEPVLDDSPGGSTRLMEAFVYVLGALARTRPVVMLLEDAGWAQGTTLDVIEWIARRVGGLPVLLLVTYRSDSVTLAHPLSAVRARLEDERRSTTLNLARLAADDVGELLRKTLHEASDALARRVFDLSEGNPLFAAHLLQSFLERGELTLASEGGASLHHVLTSRIALLDEAARAVADAGCVAGRSFTSDLVARTLGWPESDVADALDTLLDRGLVRQASAGRNRFTFAHSLIASALYELLPESQRTSFHRRLAKLLVQINEVGADAPATVARHWQLAGNNAEAAKWYLGAARSALALRAREEAVAYATASLNATDDPRMRYEALYISASAHRHWSPNVQWDSALTALERQAESIGPNERFDAAMLRSVYAMEKSDIACFEKTVSLLRELASATQSDAHWVEAKLAASRYHVSRSDYDSALAVIRGALERVTLAGDPHALFRVQTWMAGLHAQRGSIGEARALVSEAKSIAAEHEIALDNRLYLHNVEAVIAAYVHDPETLARAGAELLEMATAAQDVHFQAEAHVYLAAAATHRHDFQKARAYHRRALELFELIGNLQWFYVVSIDAASIELYLGRARDALDYLDKAEAIARRKPETRALSAVYRTYAFLMLGLHGDAHASALEAMESAGKPGNRAYVLDRATIASIEVQRSLHQVSGDAIPALMDAVARSLDREDTVNASEALCVLIDVLLLTGKLESARSYVEMLQTFCETRERHQLVHIERICDTLARAARANGDENAYEVWRARGTSALRASLAELSDAGDADAFSKLPFNSSLLTATASTAQVG